MHQTIQDIRHGFRALRHQRWFAVVAIVTLALGTGASAAIFSVIDAALLHPLPYPRPEQIVSITVVETAGGETMRLGGSIDDVRAWAASRESLVNVAIERTVFPAVVLDAGAPERVESMNVTEEYFPLFGVAPVAGRLFSIDDTRPGAPVALVISHGFWQSRFGGDRSVLQKTVHFDGKAATIVGILPPGFGRKIPIWRALQVPPDSTSRRGMGWDVLGRLRDGVIVERAAAQLASVLPGSGTTPAATVHLASRLDDVSGAYTTTVTIIGSAVGVVLLLACVNVAGLLLARGTARLPELAIRASLGATRGRLIRLVLTESLLLSIVGGLTGVLLAWITLDTIVANIPIELPGDAPARINGFVLAATAGVVTITGLLFGLVPALRLSRVRTTMAMARAGQQRAVALSRRGGQSLIAIEVALAVVMLTGTGLMLRSFATLMSVDLGIDPASYVTLSAETLDTKPQVSLDYYKTLVDTVRRMPGVAAVGAVDSVPLGEGGTFGFAHAPGAEPQEANISAVLPGYFEALDLRPTAGRVIARDDLVSKRRVVVISQAAARKMLPGADAIGRRLELGANQAYEVIGVVPDVRQWGPRRDPDPHVYLPVAADASSTDALVLHLVIRPQSGAAPTVADLRRAALSTGTPALVADVRQGSDWLSDRVANPRRRTVLLSLLGALGLILAIVGVLGVTSYAVSRRTQEAGIRLALGARPAQVTIAMLRDAVLPILIGAAAGTAAAAFSTKVIESFLFRTSPTDAVTMAGVAATLIASASLAAWFPARRAARVDPVSALRAD
jgi:predicted permease